MRTRMMVVGFALVVALALVLLLPGSDVTKRSAPAYWPTRDWQTGTPEEQGADSSRLADALLTIRNKQINVHSLLLARRGQVVVDAYFYPYDGTTVHDLGSVTKSVITTLIGIAIDQGRLTLDQPMLSFFTDRHIANRDARKERITVRDLVSMSSGIDCTRAENEATQRAMRESPDNIQFVLDQPVRWDPGAQFVYCSPGMHLLSAILQQAAGMTALEFARTNLFEPLGIRDVLWPADPQGVTLGAGDLKLHPRDAAKLGYLWWSGGVWEGRQIVSRRWVEAAVKPYIKSDGDDHYGYGWWISTEEDRQLNSYRADGRGGQYVVVVPALDLLVATTGGGFVLDEIGPLLVAALADMTKPLPANPAGVARLQAAVAAVARPPARTPAPALPGTAKRISGKTFAFEANPLEIESMRLSFGGTGDAVVHFRFGGDGGSVSWPVGLDGLHRMSPGEFELRQGLRGVWADERTFVVEYDSIANNDHLFLRMRFEGDRVVVEARDVSAGVMPDEAATFTGRLVRP